MALKELSFTDLQKIIHKRKEAFAQYRLAAMVEVLEQDEEVHRSLEKTNVQTYRKRMTSGFYVKRRER